MDNQTVTHRQYPLRRNASGVVFATEAVRDPHTTGAVAPSSRSLARALTAAVDQHGRPLSVLEVGAGTGSVTRELLSRTPPGSTLDIVEANPRFAAQLRHLVGAVQHPRVSGSNVAVHNADIAQFDTDRRYDVIVSGLPFANFAPDDVENIVTRYLEWLRPGGTLTYFAYRGTMQARRLFAGRGRADRHREVERVLTHHRSRHVTSCTTVWANLPPAKVWRLQLTAQPHQGRELAFAQQRSGGGDD